MSRSIGVVLLAACGRLSFDPLESPPIPSDGAGDGPRACVAFGPWGNVQRLADISTPDFDLAPALHPNGLFLVFDTVIGTSRELVLAKRNSTDELFHSSIELAVLNSNDDDMQAGWSADGTRLHFHRLGGVDQRMVAEYLGDGAFAPPVIDTTFPVNSDNPAFSPDGKELFFTTYSGDSDVGHARLVDGGWIVDNEVNALNSQLAEGYPTFDGPRQTVYFERDNGIGGSEIAFATRPDAFSPFGTPQTLSDLAMPTGKNGDPEVSADGRQMVFASERTGSAMIDLYLATRDCL